MKSKLSIFVAGLLTFSMVLVFVNTNAVAFGNDKDKSAKAENKETIIGTVAQVESKMDKKADSQKAHEEEVNENAESQKADAQKEIMIEVPAQAENAGDKKQGDGQVTEKYFVKNNEKSAELAKLIGKRVEVTGIVHTAENGKKTIEVTEFEPVVEKDKKTTQKTTY